MVNTCIGVRCFLVLKYCRLLLQLVVIKLRAALVTHVDLVIPAACVVVSVPQVDLVIPATCASVGVVKVFIVFSHTPKNGLASQATKKTSYLGRSVCSFRPVSDTRQNAYVTTRDLRRI